MLELKDVEVAYGDVQVLWGVSLEVRPSEIISLVGANGAGKTTTLRTISGLLRPLRGEIRFLGERIDRLSPARIVDLGIAHVPEGRQIFSGLTVQENLELGAFLPRARRERARSLAWVYELFPRLAERRQQLAGTLSGGEQQMVAIGRGLMSHPRLLILDEPSLGLAPLMVQVIFETIARINAEGTAVMLVEQNLSRALSVSHRGYVLQNGVVVLRGSGQELLVNEQTRRAYLGLHTTDGSGSSPSAAAP